MSFGIELTSPTGVLRLDGLERPLAQIVKYVSYTGTCPPIYIQGLSAKVAEGTAVVYSYDFGTGRRQMPNSPAETSVSLFIAADTVQGKPSRYRNFVIILYI